MATCPKCGSPVYVLVHDDWTIPTTEIRCTKCDISVYAINEQVENRKKVEHGQFQPMETGGKDV